MGARRRWIGAAVVMGAVLALSPAGDAQSNPTPPPVPTLSSTDLHVGDVVTVQGTGCIDPETGTGDGLTAMVFRWRQSRGEAPTNGVDLPVAADGSYGGEWHIDQDLPNGPVAVAVTCNGGSLNPYELLSDRLPATGTSPWMPDLVGPAGAVVPIAYACPEDGYGFEIAIDTPAGGASIELAENFIGTVGQTMHGRIPTDLAPGTYTGTATCDGEGGTYAHYNVRLVVSAPGTAAAPAPAATPQPGTSDYTG